jgi:hypothetical protein
MGFYTSVNIRDRVKTHMRLGEKNIVNEALERYYIGIIVPETVKIESIFTRKELTAIFNICRDVKWESPESVRGGVLARVEDATDDKYKSVSRDAIAEKLKSLTVVQQYALAEMIQFHWYIDSKKGQD